MVTIGVDIGGTNVRLGIVDREGNLACFYKWKQNERFKKEPYVVLVEEISGMLRKQCIGSEEVTALCIAVPATISKDGSHVLDSPNIKEISQYSQKWMEERLKIPVSIEKDVNALLWYDIQTFGMETADTTIVGCYVGTGLGNGICIDGRLYRGYTGSAGELGHIPAWETDTVCSCGNIGCVESYLGGRYLDQLIQEKKVSGEIGEIFSLHAQEPMFEQYIDRLARTIAGEINILDPSWVVLGGGVLAMTDFPQQKLIERIQRYLRRPYPKESVKFQVSRNTGENGVIGAGLIAWEKNKGL